jgi:hypothetical protein
MAIVQSAPYPEVSYTADIFAPGVIFDDGTIFKTFTLADFDDLGVTYFRFIRPASAKTSVCHRTLIYDGTVVIGKPRS